MSVRACVGVCVCECIRARVYTHVYMCVCARARVCVKECYVCVCVLASCDVFAHTRARVCSQLFPINHNPNHLLLVAL